MKKILVIDDEKPTLGMFELFLGAYGYKVLTAENGAIGLEIFEKEKPPIVLTDIKMPGMDGLEVLKRIKEIDPSAEVIVITGHGDMDLAVRALRLNATDFINKPIQKKALDDALRRAEQRHESAQYKFDTKVTTRRIRDITIIDIEGDLTDTSKDRLSEAYGHVTEGGARKIILHFDSNCAIDGAGMEFLIKLLSEQKPEDQIIAIVGISENLKRVFKMVGITKFANIYENEADGIEALS
jgi:anti-anti-sigma factor